MSDENTTAAGEGAAEEAPLLRVVRGTPDDAELAALTAAVAGMASVGSEPEQPHRPLSVWADRSRGLRHPDSARPHRTGPGAWWASSLPG